LFVSPDYAENAKDFEKTHPNVRIIEILELEDLETYKNIKELGYKSLPQSRTNHKDTLNFMILMNAKTEFVLRAYEKCKFWQFENMAWIDFSICHVIQNPIETLKRLYNFANNDVKCNGIYFPGCSSNKISQINDEYQYLNQVIWRFCGGFFFGNIEAISQFNYMEKVVLKKISEKYDIISWEVNIWALVEYYYEREFKGNYPCSVYIADHNDQMLNNINFSYFIEPNNNCKYDVLNGEYEVLNNGEIIYKNELDNFDISKYVDKIFYINLEYRKDRREQIESELNRFNLPYERFEAIATPDFGIVGCGYSHLGVLKLAKERGYKNVLIFEDDFIFLESKAEFVYNFKQLFEINPTQFDICMLSYNLIKFENDSSKPYLLKALDVQTASGYIVNNTMYDNLIGLYEWAFPLLSETRKHWIYANDQIWKKFQKETNWYCFKIRLGKQRPSYSDNGKSWAELDC
jgi:hypothetical protein